MQSVPKIVRERLRADALAGAHPDVDMLTAYAEKSLPERERSVVIEHLARCGQCRDVLALALPEIETQTVVIPARGGWFTWPVLRWGLVAAGIVAIVSLGVVQYQRRASQTATVAKAVPSPMVAAPSGQTQPSTSTATSPVIANSDREKPRENNEDNARTAAKLVSPKLASPKEEVSVTTTEKKVMAPAKVPPTGAPRVRSNFAAPITGGPNMPAQSQQQQTGQAQMQASAPLPMAPNAKQQVAVVAGGVGRGAQPASPSTQQVVVEVQSASSQLQTETKDVENQIHSDVYAMSKAKPATSAQAELAARAPSPNPLPSARMQTVTANALPLPRWTISSAGGLQRSFDQGSSWQDVDVTASAAPSKLASVETAGAAFADKKYQGAKSVKALVAAPVFRAVAANGADVWAGGVNGVLYHSADAGNHWSRVLPIPGIAAVAGDIVAVEFSDPQHGKIATSTGETWTTGDGGRTWQKQ